jgi:hypothetical protein
MAAKFEGGWLFIILNTNLLRHGFVLGMFNSQMAAKFEGGWLLITLDADLSRHGSVQSMLNSQNGRQAP